MGRLRTTLLLSGARLARSAIARIAEAREADKHHRPGGGLGNRERGHVAVDGEPERAETARPRDLNDVSPGLLIVPERGGRADDRRLAAQGRGRDRGLVDAEPRTIEVVIEHFAFAPPSIETAPGDTVVFTNHDITPHTATAVDGSWTTKDIASGKSEKLVIPANGVGAYFCRYHPVMKGRLVITDAH
jgi:plastocyanin